MDWTLSLTECADGSAYISSPAGGVMAFYDSWVNAAAVLALIGVGAP
jgi:hypothetical protein